MIRLQNIKKQRIDREKLLEELAFEEWLGNLSDSDKTKLAKPLDKLGGRLHNIQLRDVWNKKQEKLLTQKD